MNLTEFLIQAVASLIAIITFLIVLNVQRSMLIPGGILGMSIWLLYYVLKGPTNVIVATFIAAIVGSCISQILSIVLKTPVVVFMLSILAPLVPGYILALVISIGMASGSVVLKLYHSYQRYQKRKAANVN